MSVVLGHPARAAGVTEEEKATLATLHEAVGPLGNLRGIPGGCPAIGQGAVELRTLFERAGIPAPEAIVTDGWERPVRAWCARDAWAAISYGADGLPGTNYGAILPIDGAGDDLIFFGDGRLVLPPELEVARQVGAQRRTMANIRSLATVFEVYKQDQGALPGGPSDGWQPVERLRDLVQPMYIRTLPALDGWGGTFLYRIEDGRYSIVSAGRDGKLAMDWWTSNATGPIASPDDDLVFADGEFVRWAD